MQEMKTGRYGDGPREAFEHHRLSCIGMGKACEQQLGAELVQDAEEGP